MSDFRDRAARIADQMLTDAGIPTPPSMDTVLDIIGRTELMQRRGQPVLIVSVEDFGTLLVLLATAEGWAA